MIKEKKEITVTCDKCGKEISDGFNHREKVLPVNNDVCDVMSCSYEIGYGSSDADLCRKCFVDIFERIIKDAKRGIK